MTKHRSRMFFHHFWTRESGLTSMLILHCLLNFILLPLFWDHRIIVILINLFWMMFILAGISCLAKSRSQRLLLSIFPLLFIIARWIIFFNDHPFVLYCEFYLGIMTYLLFIGLILVKVFDLGPITNHRIVGAIVVYMMIGNLFAVVFTFMNLVVPGSFNLENSTLNPHSTYLSLLYFSYTTLTTTGFGDIRPVGMWVREIVMIEQMIGVLYPVILIGKLVSSNTGKK